MMRSFPLYAPDGMSSGVQHADRFDDGLVHNHHWAVTTNEAYPAHHRPAAGRSHERTFSGSVRHRVQVTHAHDRHDDGLVHNHHWAVTEK